MYRLPRLPLLVLLCLAGLAVLLGGCARNTPTDAQTLSHAELRGVVDGRCTAAAPARTVRLPDAWNHRDRAGIWCYDLTLTLAQEPTVVQALYIPRAGNRLTVWVNGTLVAQWGHFGGDTRDFGLAPLLVPVPFGQLHAGANRVRFMVQGDTARAAGLSAVMAGPLGSLQALHQRRYAIQTWGPFAMMTVALAFAGLGALLGRLMRDPAFSLAALTCTFFAGYSLLGVWGAQPSDFRVWDALTEWCHAGYLVALAALARQVLGAPQLLRWSPLTVLLAMAAAVLVPLYAWGRLIWVWEAWEALLMVFGAVLVARLLDLAWRSNEATVRVVAGGVTLTLVLCFIAYVSQRLGDAGYTAIDATRYSLLAVLGIIVWLLADRWRALVRQQEAARLASQAELGAQRQRLESRFEASHRAARQQERRRILRDIHDGMGLQLTSLLALTQDKAVGHERLTREVRIAIEQMRLLVDNAEAFEGDVGMLLDQIRYQIGRRLGHSGTVLHWQTALSHPDRVLKPAQTVALQRLVFELTTNVLKHARATEVEVLVRDDAAGALHLMFADDGIGLDESQHRPGMGLRSIQERAQEMGAQLARQPGGPGTRYRLSLPPTAFET